MDVSGQIHASAALSSRNELPSPTEYNAERNPQPIRMITKFPTAVHPIAYSLYQP
jgi:hypothetical protein